MIQLVLHSLTNAVLNMFKLWNGGTIGPLELSHNVRFPTPPLHEECTPQAGAGHLGYGDASPSDIERTFTLAEKFEEERYQQLKQNAQVEDDAKILPLLKRKWPCSNDELGDIQASPCHFSHNVTNSPEWVVSVPSTNPTTPRKCRKLQAPFEFNPHAMSQSKTLVEALLSVQMALERHTAVLSRMCQAMENLNIKYEELSPAESYHVAEYLSLQMARSHVTGRSPTSSLVVPFNNHTSKLHAHMYFKCGGECNRSFSAPRNLTTHRQSCKHWQKQLHLQSQCFKHISTSLQDLEAPAAKKMKLSTQPSSASDSPPTNTMTSDSSDIHVPASPPSINDPAIASSSTPACDILQEGQPESGLAGHPS
ncbi:hypothetical protein BD769DRAFT_1384859 [Suillus cothurnatus]|nr:hypothetical protein BD769DRAFT_1384859 [Suillus cothurnatus]